MTANGCRQAVITDLQNRNFITTAAQGNPGGRFHFSYPPSENDAAASSIRLMRIPGDFGNIDGSDRPSPVPR